MKKVISVFLAMVMILSFASACQEKQDITGSSGSSSSLSSSSASEQQPAPSLTDEWEHVERNNFDKEATKNAIGYLRFKSGDTPDNEIILRSICAQLETWENPWGKKWNILEFYQLFCPATASCEGQIMQLDKCIDYGVSAVIISQVSLMGYDEIYNKLHQANIAIISFNAPINSDTRVTHVNLFDRQGFAEYALACGVMATTKTPYDPNADLSLVEQAKQIILAYEYDTMYIGIMSTSPDSVVHAQWVNDIMALTKGESEFNNCPCWMRITLDVKYMKQDQTYVPTVMNEFMDEGRVSAIINLPPVSSVNACKAIEAAGEKGARFKLTGFVYVEASVFDGFTVNNYPSYSNVSLAGYVPTQKGENIYDYICPIAFTFDRRMAGNTAAAATAAALNGKYKGDIDELLAVNESSGIDGFTRKTFIHTDGFSAVSAMEEPYLLTPEGFSTMIELERWIFLK